jgi:Flp pilus assembly pilin Flp
MWYVEDKLNSLAARAAGSSRRFGDLLRRLRRETAGNTAIEYVLMLAGISVGGGGLTSVIGVDLSALFDVLGLEFCLQAAQTCVGR